jgi:hypothetical protein
MCCRGAHEAHAKTRRDGLIRGHLAHRQGAGAAQDGSSGSAWNYQCELLWLRSGEGGLTLNKIARL